MLYVRPSIPGMGKILMEIKRSNDGSDSHGPSPAHTCDDDRQTETLFLFLIPAWPLD
jgi:hypothetical protein